MKYLLIFFITGSIYANAGMFASKGESMISIEGQYENEDIEGGTLTSTIFGGSYVLNGNLEVGGSYGMAKAKGDNDSSTDYDMTLLEYGGFYHIKESETVPVNIKLGGTFATVETSADWMDDAGVDLSLKGSSFGGGVYKNV